MEKSLRALHRKGGRNRSLGPLLTLRKGRGRAKASEMGTRLERIQETLGLDLRSLAVLRMLLGGMLIVDYSIRAIAFRAHYTDFGIAPAAFQIARVIDPFPGRYSFHLGDPSLQMGLFALAVAFAISLLVGFQTKLSLLGSFILMVSVQNRNMEIETGGDYLLRLVTFWSLFLPLGARFSLDARLGAPPPDPKSGNIKGNQYFSVATAALLVQMAIVYFFSAVHKDHPIWRVHHTAIHYALHIDAYDTSLGELLRQYPVITAALTRLTLGYEFVAPFLIFGAGLLGLLPGLEKVTHPIQGMLRTFVSIAFVFFHLGLACTLSLGTFAWFAALIWLGLLPTWAWERLSDFRKGVIPPDPYAALDGPKEAKAESASEAPPWFYRFRTPRVLSRLSQVEAFFLRFEERKKKPRTQRLPRSARLFVSSARDAFAGVALFYVVLWNLNTVTREPFGSWMAGRGDSPLPDARPLINFLRLDQHWGLFAPYPRTTDGYYVVLGRKMNGDEIDFLRDDYKVTWEKPRDVSGSYETFRWKTYFRNIRRSSHKQHLALYSNYVCRAWNEKHSADDKLNGVSIFFMRRDTRAKGGHKPTQKERLWVQGCQDAYKSYEEIQRHRPTRRLESIRKTR
jgi:hypothetical protein